MADTTDQLIIKLGKRIEISVTGRYGVTIVVLFNVGAAVCMAFYS